MTGDDANTSLSKFFFFLHTFGPHLKLVQFNIFSTGHILGNASIKIALCDSENELSG